MNIENGNSIQMNRVIVGENANVNKLDDNLKKISQQNGK
jgi:hypothetical protein